MCRNVDTSNLAESLVAILLYIAVEYSVTSNVLLLLPPAILHDLMALRTCGSQSPCAYASGQYPLPPPSPPSCHSGSRCCSCTKQGIQDLCNIRFILKADLFFINIATCVRYSCYQKSTGRSVSLLFTHLDFVAPFGM